MTMYLFVRIGPNGLIPILCQTAEKWRLLRETEPTKLTYSLKMALFKQLLISLHEGLTTTAKDKQAMDKAQATGWLDEYKHWRMLKWNPQQQKLEVDVNLRTVSTEDMLGQVRGLLSDLAPPPLAHCSTWLLCFKWAVFVHSAWFQL
eukprot:s745_g18.t1